MKIYVTVFVVLIFLSQFDCKEGSLEDVDKNESLSHHEENEAVDILRNPYEKETLKENIENRNNFNSPLLSDINDSETPENPFAVKEKRCPRYRLGSPLIGSSINLNADPSYEKKNQLYETFCKTCLLRNKCQKIRECPLCEKWCTRACPENDPKIISRSKTNPAVTKDDPDDGKFETDETVGLASRGAFEKVEEEDKSKYYTTTLKRGSLMEIILVLLGVNDSKGVESMTIGVKSNGDVPIKMRNFEENPTLGEKGKDLIEKVRDIKNALTEKIFSSKDKVLDFAKLDQFVSDILNKIRSTGGTAEPKDSTVGSSNTGDPNVVSRFKEPHPDGNLIRQSKLNPDIIEGSPDMAQIRDQRVRSNSDYVGSSKDLQNNIEENSQKPEKSFRRKYEPLNSKDLFNKNDQTVGKIFDPLVPNKAREQPNFEEDDEVEEDPVEDEDIPEVGAAHGGSDLPQISHFDAIPKPSEVMNRLQAQHNENLQKNIDANFKENPEGSARTPTFHKPNSHLSKPKPHFIHHSRFPQSGFPRANEPDGTLSNNDNLGSQLNVQPVGTQRSNNPNSGFSNQPFNGFIHQPNGMTPQQLDLGLRQAIENLNNELKSRFGPQQMDKVLENINKQLNSGFGLNNPDELLNNIVGQPNYNRDSQLNSKFGNPVGQPTQQFLNDDNLLNSRFSQQQINNAPGQRFANDVDQLQSKVPTGQTLNNQENELNSRSGLQNPDEVLSSRGEIVSSFEEPFSHHHHHHHDQIRPNGPHFHLNDPHFNPNGPHFQPNGPHFQPNGPHFHPNDPHFRPNDPHFLPDFRPVHRPGVPFPGDPFGPHDHHRPGPFPFGRNPNDFDGFNFLGQTFDPNGENREPNMAGNTFDQSGRNQNNDRIAENKNEVGSSVTNANQGRTAQNNQPILSSERIVDDQTPTFGEPDSDLKKNPIGSRTSDLIKRLKDRQDETIQRIAKQKEQLEKARANVFGVNKPENDVGNKNLDSSVLRSAINSKDIPKAVQDSPDKPPTLQNRINEDVVGSQPLEGGFERSQAENSNGRRPFINQRLGSVKESRRDEDLLRAFNPDSTFNVENDKLGTAREEFDNKQEASNAFGSIVSRNNDVDISFKKPTDVYFIGKGIKLPLQMVQQKDGAVHFSVDVDKLCSCNNTSCPNNHTAKDINRTVETILEKEAELKDQLKDYGDEAVGMAASNFDNGRNQRQAKPENKFLAMKNKIANRFEHNHNGFFVKRSIDDKENEIPDNKSKDLTLNINNKDYIEEFGKKGKLAGIFKNFVNKGLKDIKVAFANRKQIQLDNSQDEIITKNPKNFFTAKTLEDNNENIIPISKIFKFKPLEDQLEIKMENIEKSLDNYSQMDDKIFENESVSLKNIIENPKIQKQIGLVSDFLGFLKKVAVDNAKNKS